MTKAWKLRLTLLFVLTCLMSTLGDGQISSPSASSPYKNFVGEWSGRSKYVENGKIKSDFIELKITERPKGKGMSFDYAYSKSGEPNYDSKTKLVSFKQKKSRFTVVIQWEDAKDEIYEADGLDRFEQTGYGSFTFVQSPNDAARIGRQRIYRGTFELSPDTFVYRWEVSSDGKKFGLYSLFELKRKPIDNLKDEQSPLTTP